MHFLLISLFGVLGVQPTLAAESEIDRLVIVEAVVDHLETEYVDPDVGKLAADRLNAAWQAGAFQKAKSHADFADAIGTFLRAETGDGHLDLEYSETPVADDGLSAEDYSEEEMERWYGAHLNYGFQKVERLDSNVCVLDLMVFAPLKMGQATADAAMTFLSNCAALIFDLRKNGGGHGEMVAYLIGYLFDEGGKPLTGTYDRIADTLTGRTSPSDVSGPRFGETKPITVLISKRTFSAAENFAYDLQALGRAAIIGEPSGGGAHPFEYKHIHPHFVLSSVTAKSVNPITGTNWQGVGVTPDLHVPADTALQVAVERLENKNQ